MAVAAETYNLDITSEVSRSPRSHLRLVDQAMLDAASLLMDVSEFGQGWVSADDVPTLRAVREQSDIEAQDLLAKRHHQLNEGKFSEVPYAFNPLTTASRLLEAERAHGTHSERYQKLLKGFRLDVKRHRDEARRRLTWEYFPEIEQAFDADADSYVYGGYKLKEVVDNGLSPVGSEAVGTDVLIANRREEHTSTAVGKLGQLMLSHSGVELANKQLIMLTVSQIDVSPQTMIWALRFDPKYNRRFQEQVALPKHHITSGVVTEALKRKGVLSPDAQPTKQDILDVQSINVAGEGVLDFTALLDEIASEQSGKNIFMGEVVAEDFRKDYTAIPAEAVERQAQNQEEVETLMAEILRLSRSGTDGWHANLLIDRFVTDMLLDKVADDPQSALHIFGKQTAGIIEQSMWLRQQGDILAAEEAINTARIKAPLAVVCTGGSCGLESVDMFSSDGQKIAEKLGAKPGDTVLKDKVRACKCGRVGTVYYAYNKTKVNKYCGGCEGKESKITGANKAA